MQAIGTRQADAQDEVDLRVGLLDDVLPAAHRLTPAAPSAARAAPPRSAPLGGRTRLV
jgi:hypothetical protein